MNFILVQTSIDTEEAAQKLSKTIVEKRLAACCWVAGPIRSTYWWKGQLEQAQEWVCNFKTRVDLYNQLEEAIKASHSYDVPEIVATSIVAGSKDYLDWLQKETIQ